MSKEREYKATAKLESTMEAGNLWDGEYQGEVLRLGHLRELMRGTNGMADEVYVLVRLHSDPKTAYTNLKRIQGIRLASTVRSE